MKELANIVLHSDCPHIAPHIVITPAGETPDDFYIPWNNRTLPQWSGFLVVPPCDLTTSRLYPYHCQPPPRESDNQSSDESTLADEDTMKGMGVLSKRVFCHSRFRSFVRANLYLSFSHRSRSRLRRPQMNDSYCTMWPGHSKNTSVKPP